MAKGKSYWLLRNRIFTHRRIYSLQHGATGCRVLQRYFAGKTDLVKLTIDTSKLNVKLQYDFTLSIGEAFPHIYGNINPDAIIDTGIV
ncbi:hypothetical protein BH10BAC2_BH10BAC2_26280 [soil metagenome]